MDTAWPGTVVSPKNFSFSGLDLEPLFHLADFKTNFAPSPRRGPCAGPPLSSFPLNLAHRESPLPLKLSLEVPGTTPRCAVPASPPAFWQQGSAVSHIYLDDLPCHRHVRCPIFLESPLLSSTNTTPTCFLGKKPLGTGVLLLMQFGTSPPVSNVDVFPQALASLFHFLSSANAHLHPPPGSPVSHPQLMPRCWAP